MIPAVLGRYVVNDVLAYVVHEVGGAMWDWAKKRVISFAARKAKEWMTDLFDWTVEKLFGKKPDDIQRAGVAEETIEVDSVMTGQTLTERLRALFASGEGALRLGRWLQAIARDSGLEARHERWLIDAAPIPRDKSLFEWAADVAARLGMDPNTVLERRLSLS